MFNESLYILALATLVLVSSCSNNDDLKDSNIDFYVALTTSPVKVQNTTGVWFVYEMHVKASSLSKVDIYNEDNLQLSYTDFRSRDDIHLASIWIEYPEAGWQNQELTHKFQYKDATGLEKHYTFNLQVQEQYQDPITIAFPVPQGVWLAEGAPGSNSYHTRSLFPFAEPFFDEEQQGYLFGNNPQRYAIDYAMLLDGLPYLNDGSNLEDWHCYNLPIIAARGGKVIYTKDGIPDNQSPPELDYSIDENNVTGNVVYIEHVDGTIGTYCHLVQNSVKVEIGDTVVTGQELGRLGNSGNSTAPHLHMHVLTNPENKQLTKYSDGLYLESLPYKFTQFTKLGVAPIGYLDIKPIYPFIPTTPKVFNNVLPSESDVIEF